MTLSSSSQGAIPATAVTKTQAQEREERAALPLQPFAAAFFVASVAQRLKNRLWIRAE